MLFLSLGFLERRDWRKDFYDTALLGGFQGNEAEKLATAWFKDRYFLSLLGPSSNRLSNDCYLRCLAPTSHWSKVSPCFFLNTPLLPSCTCVDTTLCLEGGRGRMHIVWARGCKLSGCTYMKVLEVTQMVTEVMAEIHRGEGRKIWGAKLKVLGTIMVSPFFKWGNSGKEK